MAIPVYLWLKDDGGSHFKGSVVVNNREGSIEVNSFIHSIDFPVDENTGKLTGNRIHQPLGFLKEIDASSIYLYKALTTGKMLKSAEFRFYNINNSGQEFEYYNTLLQFVKVVSITPIMYDIKDPDHENKGHIEAVELRYEKITWICKDGNIIHSDSWNERTTAQEV